MSSDSGMTPGIAQNIVSKYEAWRETWGSYPACEPAVNFNSDKYEKAKCFLQGVAYQEEKAKGLIEALDAYLKWQRSDLSECGIDLHRKLLAEFAAYR